MAMIALPFELTLARLAAFYRECVNWCISGRNQKTNSRGLIDKHDNTVGRVITSKEVPSIEEVGSFMRLHQLPTRCRTRRSTSTCTGSSTTRVTACRSGGWFASRSRSGRGRVPILPTTQRNLSTPRLGCLLTRTVNSTFLQLRVSYDQTRRRGALLLLLGPRDDHASQSCPQVCSEA